MSNPQTYTCGSCGKTHDQWPALAYTSPANYNKLSEAEKSGIGELEEDFCIIRHPEQTDRYIRCTLSLPVVDNCESLEYGLWVSLSESSYQDYRDHFDSEDQDARYFGWLSSELADYTFDKSIPTTVFTRKGRQRPEIVPHREVDHPLVKDYYNGITKVEAERRISAMMQQVEERDKEKIIRKPWWKIW